jgi:cytochrome c oxidase subunit 4
MRAAFPPARLLLSWLALLALLATTIFCAYLPLGIFNTLIGLAIAAVKALIVLAVFMELRRGPSLAWVFAGAGFFWLMILIVLSLTDYLTRAGWTLAGSAAP